MSVIPKVRNEEVKMTSLESHTTIPYEKLAAKNISDIQLPVITDPIDLKSISKVPANSLTMSSVVKVGLVFLGTVGAYYLAKTTGIFSYFGWRVKNLNPKDAGRSEIVKVKNKANTLSVKTNLKTARQSNTPSVNRIVQRYKNKDGTVAFEKIKVEEFKDFQEVEKENVGMRRSSRRSISVQNPIPDQRTFIGLPFELTIDGNSVFSSSSDLFLEATNIPAWLTSYCNPTFKSSYNAFSYTFGITVFENYAYVTGKYSYQRYGLQIIDVTNPSNPTFKGSYDTPDQAFEVALSGNYAYVADRGYNYTSGLQIIDVTNPSNPTFKGSYNTPGESLGVALSGNYAYVADSDSGLQIIDISDPANPTFKGSYTGRAHKVAVSGNYAYVVDRFSGLQIIDITDPSNSTLKGSYNTPDEAKGVALSENYAYVADRFSGLQIIDITDPSNSTLKGSYNTPGWAFEVALSGNYAYVADYKSGLQIIDISDPANPTFKCAYNTPDNAVGVTLSENYAYVADASSGLQIIAFNSDELLLEKLTLSGTPSSVGTYRVDIKACNKAEECATDSFDIIVKDSSSTDTTTYTVLMILGITFYAIVVIVSVIFNIFIFCGIPLIIGITLVRSLKKSSRITIVQQKELEVIEYDEKPPKNLCCPISSELMKNPVIVIESEQIYDEESIETWFANHDTDPLTDKKITDKQFKTSFTIKKQVGVNTHD
jgi:hypothetical protein